MSGSPTPATGRDRLIESLWLDARREAEQELQKARAEADRLLEESRQLQEKEMTMASQRASEEAMPKVSQILNRAHGHAQQLMLEGRYAFLDSCFDEVAGAVANDTATRKSVRAAFPHLLREVLSGLERREGMEVHLNPEDMESALQVLHDLRVDIATVPDETISGGVMLRTRDGSMIVDGTLEGRLAVLRETPPIELLKLLGPGKQPFSTVKMDQGWQRLD